MSFSNSSQRFTVIADLNSGVNMPVDIEVVNQAQKILEAVQLVQLGARARSEEHTSELQSH